MCCISGDPDWIRKPHKTEVGLHEVLAAQVFVRGSGVLTLRSLPAPLVRIYLAAPPVAFGRRKAVDHVSQQALYPNQAPL